MSKSQTKSPKSPHASSSDDAVTAKQTCDPLPWLIRNLRDRNDAAEPSERPVGDAGTEPNAS